VLPFTDETNSMKSDAQLKQDVMAELSWEPSVNATQIGVEVTDGIVTLAGYVGSYTEKWHAEHAAQRVSGVKGLAVEIQVKLPGLSKRIDADIARAADSVLQWSTYLPRDCIKVKAKDGWITLSGEVEWDYQRRAATNAVRDLLGVAGVTEQITIKRKPSLSTVKSEIEAALTRRISVEVRGTDVILTGIVHSWSERELATSSAWGTPGVHKVVDNLTVGY
jgi:osmotically-inducible protein OsmY